MYTPLSKRMTSRAIAKRTRTPNVALIIIAIGLALFVWGNHQLTNPPSCGDSIQTTIMNIDNGKEIRPCAPGEVPTQTGLVESLDQNFKSLLKTIDTVARVQAPQTGV